MPPLTAVPARICAGLRAAAQRLGDALSRRAADRMRKITGASDHAQRAGLADLGDLRRARRAVLGPLILVLILLAAVSSARARDGEFIEDNGFYRVTIAGRMYRLEALTVRRAEATGRLPIALIAHGKPANPQSMLDDHAGNFLGVARDLASRGWLAVAVIRRGFGQSDGPCRCRSIARPIPSCRALLRRR